MSTYWPEGMPRSLDYPAVGVGDLAQGMAITYGDQPAVVDGSLTLSYAELYEQSCALANAFHERGIGPGDVVLLHLPNSAHFLVAYYGVLLSGATVSPVNPLTPPKGMRSQLRDTGARAVITHPATVSGLVTPFAELAAEGDLEGRVDLVALVPGTDGAPAPTVDPRLPEGVPVLTLEELTAGADGSSRPDVSVGPEDVAHIVYTGGTTGEPKGVRVLHRNVIGNVTQMLGWRGAHALSATPAAGLDLRPLPAAGRSVLTVGSGSTIVVSPLFHAHALINASFLLSLGATLVLAGRFTPERVLELAHEHQATYITGSPTMWHALLQVPAERYDLGSVEVVSSGAAPIDPVTLRGLAGLFPNARVLEGYGLTEGTCVVTAASPNRDAPTVIGSVGWPMPDTEIEIRDAGGAVLPTGEKGEIWVRGPQVTGGYHQRPEATAEQFVDGWLATGDVGYLDDLGLLWIADRAKDMLIYKGYNVYPRELEDLLVEHPQITRAAVVGRDHEAFGQEPIAFVVPREGERPDPAEVMAWLAERVLPYKKLRAVQVVAALPTNQAGKILKTELRDQVPAREETR